MRRTTLRAGRSATWGAPLRAGRSATWGAPLRAGRSATRRLLLAAALALAALALPAPAGAHPLGNFSVNHLTVVRASSDRVDVRYVLDQAEIPTFRERGLAPASVLERKRAEVARGVTLTVGGRHVALTLHPGGRLSFPSGAGGLRTTRVELLLSARVATRGDVVVRDATFAGRVGWRAVLAEPGRGTAVRSDVTSADPTRRLHVYPTALLASPANRTVAHLRVSPGSGTVTAPRGDGGASTTTTDRGAGDGFGSVFERAAAGQGVLLVLLLAAFGWGAVHALSPGHGKAVLAAYLVGTRGTARHAVALGLTVTVTHTIGVFALGAVALGLSAYVLPEDLYPWLNLVAGLLVVTVGLGVLRSRLRHVRAHRAHAHHHHDHDHSHDVPDRVTWRGLAGMGAAAGLIPCPSALVVLLGAVAQHQVGLGLVLIVAFSLGLAATLTGLGLAVVYAKRVLTRVRVPGRLVAALPAASAVVIVGIGLVLTAQAIPKF
jgi:nickel/cobalt transporter (NicO) family protein